MCFGFGGADSGSSLSNYSQVTGTNASTPPPPLLAAASYVLLFFIFPLPSGPRARFSPAAFQPPLSPTPLLLPFEASHSPPRSFPVTFGSPRFSSLVLFFFHFLFSTSSYPTSPLTVLLFYMYFKVPFSGTETLEVSAAETHPLPLPAALEMPASSLASRSRAGSISIHLPRNYNNFMQSRSDAGGSGGEARLASLLRRGFPSGLPTLAARLEILCFECTARRSRSVVYEIKI